GARAQEGDMPRYSSDWFAGFEPAVSVEYITTNGAGAWASSTICGANTRRYHALLGAPVENPAGTYVFLSALEEVLAVGGARFHLSSAEYPGTVFPAGYRYITGVSRNAAVEFVFQVAGVRLQKRIVLPAGEPAVVVTYELFSPRDNVTLEVRPLCAFRDRHGLARADPCAMVIASEEKPWVVLRPFAGLPPLRMHMGGEFLHDPTWYRNVRYRRDRERGHSFEEDLMSPGLFSTPLSAGKPVSLVGVVGEGAAEPAKYIYAANRRGWKWDRNFEPAEPLARKLAAGLGDFLTGDGGKGVLRGLPWHSEWSRNALLALPGYLALGKTNIAEGILSGWAARAENGFLPRFIDDKGTPGPPDLEATLWLYEAVETYLSYSGNYEWLQANLLDFMKAALLSIMAGGRAEGEPGGDGLLYCPGSERTFAPVEEQRVAFNEVQALYFNALKAMERICGHFRDEECGGRFHVAAKAVQRGFNKLMWDANSHMPVDAYSNDLRDLTPRPMCLLSVALSHSVLVRRRWELLLDMVEGALLTPLGLRLAPADEGAKSHFPGDSFEEARRYGGIWPQFLGMYLVAHAKTFGRSRRWAADIERYLNPLLFEVDRGLIDHLPEFFDAAEPFTQRGAPADAATSGQLVWAFSAKVEPRHYGGEEA
ncbi:MAG: glycogen debranching enzyme N-terminal domain-containing protein, partial [Planctomycetota bacterium]